MRLTVYRDGQVIPIGNRLQKIINELLDDADLIEMPVQGFITIDYAGTSVTTKIGKSKRTDSALVK